MIGERLTYRFGPLERRSLLGAIDPRQAVLGAVGALGAVAVLDASPTPTGALGAAIVLGAALAIARATAQGRPLAEWLLVAGGFATRRRTQLSSRPVGPRISLHMAPRRRPGRPTDQSAGGAQALRGVRLEEVEHGGRRIGVLAEGSRRITAVVACRGRGFALLDPEAQERRLQGWGTALAALAGTPVRRLQWLERTVPTQGDELVRWYHEERDPALPARGALIVDSYLELISGGAAVAHEHEVLLALQLEIPRGESRAEVVGGQVRRIASSLAGAEVEVMGALTRGQLARALRVSFDPYARAELAAVDLSDPDRRGESTVPWPAASREAWDHVRIDGALHATFWISAWPQRPVTPTFMEPLLGASGAARVVSVCLEPVAPARAARDVEAAVTRDRADSVLRARFGQTETARARESQQAAARREQELAVGHGEVRFAGFITVSGRDVEELRNRCAEIGEQAARARLELRRMYGQQLEAFAFTLPLCRGLR